MCPAKTCMPAFIGSQSLATQGKPWLVWDTFEFIQLYETHRAGGNTLVLARNKASFFWLIYPILPYVPKQRRKVLITGVTGILPWLQSRAFSEEEFVLSLFSLMAGAHI